MIKRILSYVLICIPSFSLSAADYYVKTDGVGDGTSWEKAMPAEQFSQVLPTAEDGSNFYVAEGYYSPTSDGLNNTDNQNKYQFIVQSDVNIFGGFPADAKTGSVSNPDLYKTFFTGDLEKNDEVVFSQFPKHKDRKNVTLENTSDNTDYLFNVTIKGKKTIFSRNTAFRSKQRCCFF